MKFSELLKTLTFSTYTDISVYINGPQMLSSNSDDIKDENLSDFEDLTVEEIELSVVNEDEMSMDIYLS